MQRITIMANSAAKSTADVHKSLYQSESLSHMRDVVAVFARVASAFVREICSENFVSKIVDTEWWTNDWNPSSWKFETTTRLESRLKLLKEVTGNMMRID
jgi:hypothetical protein